MLLEVVVFNYRSAISAAEAGADRLELCDSFHEGGTTPSYGMVARLREELNIPLFAMVRPRGGDFLYSPGEVDVMKRDIIQFKSLGCNGVVLGCLTKDGEIDDEILSELVQLAAPMEVTFHRAFDRVKDQSIALERIINSGCQRILTSGGKPTAEEGVTVIKSLVDAANRRIGIIPGGKISSTSIGKIIETGAMEFHTPAHKMVKSKMDFLNYGMNESLDSVGVDKEEIHAMSQMIRVRRN